jgi:hypothetical protein
LALFSGLITIGFLDQLKLHRGRHHRSGENGQAGVSDGSDRGIQNVDAMPELIEIPEANPRQALLRASTLRVCPRCGFAPPAAH